MFGGPALQGDEGVAWETKGFVEIVAEAELIYGLG